MYLENLEPLLAIWPVIAIILGLVAMACVWSMWSARRPDRDHARQVTRYREKEMQWRSRMQRSAIGTRDSFE